MRSFLTDTKKFILKQREELKEGKLYFSLREQMIVKVTQCELCVRPHINC